MSSKGSGLPKDEIFHAIQSGNLDVLKSLITSSEHANLKDRSGHTMLYMATNLEKVEIAKWLVSTIGSDINLHCNGHTVTSLALTKGNFDLFQFYLENNGDCKGKNQLNLLHEAANKNRIDIVETLINKGADPNQLNNLHQTALTIALNHKNIDICRLLLDNGACATLPDKKGNTSLHLACSLCDSDLINLLLDNTEGDDLKMKNSTDETALDLYFVNCIKSSIEMPDQLLDRMINAGALFSVPFNFEIKGGNGIILLKAMSILCKYRLSDLFTDEKPSYTQLILNYWRNSLIVSIKTVVMCADNEKDNEDNVNNNNESDPLFKLIENIITSGQFELTHAELCSTFHLFDDVTEMLIAKRLRAFLSRPLRLKELTRIQTRRCLSGGVNRETIEKLSNQLSDDLKDYLFFTNNNQNQKSILKTSSKAAVLVRTNSSSSTTSTTPTTKNVIKRSGVESEEESVSSASSSNRSSPYKKFKK